jgi:hypothetical protein
MSTPEVIDMKGPASVDPATGLPAPRRRRPGRPDPPSAPTPLLVPVAAEAAPGPVPGYPWNREPWEAGLQHGNTSPYKFPAWSEDAVRFLVEHHGKDTETEVLATLERLAGNIKADLRIVLGPGMPEMRAIARERLARSMDSYQGWLSTLPAIRAALAIGGSPPTPLELPRLWEHLRPGVHDIRAEIDAKVAGLRAELAELDRDLADAAAILRGPKAAYYAAVTRPGNMSADYHAACRELSKAFYGEAGRDPATFAMTAGVPVVIHGGAPWLATGPLEWILERSTKWLRRRADILARIAGLEDDLAYATGLAAQAAAKVVEEAGGRARVLKSAETALMLRPDDPKRWPRTPTPRSEAEAAKGTLDGLDRELLARRDWSAPDAPGMTRLEARRESAHATWMQARASHVHSCESAALALVDGSLAGDEASRLALEALVRERPAEFADGFADALATAGPESVIIAIIKEL